MIERHRIWIARPDSKTPKEQFEIFTGEPEIVELFDGTPIWVSDKPSYFMPYLEGVEPVYESLHPTESRRAELSIDTDTACNNCYIAREASDYLVVSKTAPEKDMPCGMWVSATIAPTFSSEWCKNAKWEDDRPTPARIEIKLIDE